MKKGTGLPHGHAPQRTVPGKIHVRIGVVLFWVAFLPAAQALGGDFFSRNQGMGGDVPQHGPDMQAKVVTTEAGLPTVTGNSLHRRKTAPLQKPVQELAEALAADPQEGNVTRRALLSAARRGDYLPAISWSLSRRDWSLAQFLVHADPRHVPGWVYMSLALHNRDMEELHHLVSRPGRYPSRDLFRSYMDLGEYWQARTVALHRLQVQPDDRKIRKEYLEAVRLTADSADLTGMWQSFGGLQLYGPKADLRMHFQHSRWGFQVKNRTLWPSANASAYLQHLPGIMNMLEAGVFREGRSWQSSLTLGQYRALRNTLTARAAVFVQMTRDTQVSATLDYHDQSFQSPVMAVGGMADRTRLQVAQQLGDWILDAGGGWTQYQGQDGLVQGSDRYVEAGVFWQGGLGPWRIRLGPFASFHAMQRSGQVRGIVNSLLEPGARNMDFVLPPTYADYGVRLSWGARPWGPEAVWMPHLGLSLYDNTRFGFQYQLDAGISTPVLGPDQLSLDFSQGQGGNGLALNQRTVELGYRFFF